MKEEKDRACNLELAPGLHDVRYNQRFVRAPKSLYPQKENTPKDRFYASNHAMKISMGE